MSSVIVSKAWHGTVSLIAFRRVAEVSVMNNVLLGTKTIRLRLHPKGDKGDQPGGSMDLGPFYAVPPGLCLRLEKACNTCKVEPIVQVVCLLDGDATLEAVLSELGKLHQQKTTFWEREGWFPKTQATAYYRREDNILWAILYIKHEHKKPEWILQCNGKIESSDWEEMFTSF